MPGFDRSTGHKNMLQLIHLRWIAVFGQMSTIALVTLGFGMQLPLLPLLYVLAALITFNIGSHLRWHEEVSVSNRELFLAMLVDVAILTAQLYLCGGTSNPFAFLYLLQIILGAMLLQARSTWLIVVITSACLFALSFFNVPLQWPAGQFNSVSELYRDGMIICFVLNAALLVFFLTRISANLRSRDAELAMLQQQAIAEEHIVRMGLLASGAAHELGTPLATLAVILGDWRRMPSLNQDPELLEEISEMQRQIQRCKSIVSGVLLSAGEARGESALKTTLHTFVREVVEEFRATRPVLEFYFDNQIVDDLPMVSDSVLKQMICNLLDNALEASPSWVALAVACLNGQLQIVVSDHGAGFASTILDTLGQPYQSTKGRPGSGLGIFFVVNVVRKLGGTIEARNGTAGAIVTILLPLSGFIL
ncbi:MULTISPECIES: ATP-binding protein [unclassified Undibacterium]|uniref:ATP-binding protein n=1 Tax=unclassified Undibacterium TaxID=2630295 RepID=UPI002AC99F94|nr:MULTISPECIES: ATP-binding protein [unclassified Undibacterium]MEB0140228.1 ATP-binding protein [Undibacterium sp. CCC2.1]MEB0173233.1 ATP-binding protein [Undibacterium sp. CCC1.1]MEB0177078.1 ATP-binding protein [Undibacterium sp. CCC3.4]MEB0216341.1 ATP-binding protein [Undibacterium sp. 5I2]WPX45625.1 ATP-binding protein [Undibacterium sp. CCC3.4]